jgi:hypothetical protein
VAWKTVKRDPSSNIINIIINIIIQIHPIWSNIISSTNHNHKYHKYLISRYHL